MSDEGAPVALRDDVVWQSGEGTVIVLDTRSSRYLSIGGTGPLLWDLIAEGTTEAALAAHLEATFAIDAEMAEHDVHAFVDHLRTHDLLAV